MESKTLYIVVLLSILSFYKCASATRVIASAPVNPIEKDGILSVRCQVWELENSHDVTLLRTISGTVQRLSLGEDVMSNAGDRVFLAVRHMGDGSVVYFLSIMNVERSDEGNYTCSVRGTALGNQIATSSIRMNVTYFPSDSDPVCESIPTRVNVGTSITLNCSSDEGFPRVALKWSQAGEKDLRSYNVVKDGRIRSTYSFQVSESDQNSVFLCTVSSKEFPTLNRQCHVGPLTVLSKSGHIIPNLTPERVERVTPTPRSNGGVSSPGLHYDVYATLSPPNCDQVCAEITSQSAFYWIVSSAVGFIFAILFLIIVIVLLLKYCRLSNRRHATYMAALPSPSEKVYAELDIRRCDNKVYMTLEKNENNTRQKYLFHNEMPDHYHSSPTRPNPQ
ncbi:uncharacterized protein [Amphiura filiformis]|uniref:uncharacterized protein n=1 Tax=Amphiura filiformis TaxID=82378 RepID=UPI003B210B44